MMQYMRAYGLVSALIAGGIVLFPLAMAEFVRDETKVVLPIEYVHSGVSRDGSRIRSAVLSADFVCDLSSAEVEKLAPQLVDGLARRLEDPVYARHAADVLGCIGPAAKAAIPALERALKKAKPTEERGIVIQPQFRLDNVIRSAVMRVRDDPQQ